MRIALDFDSVLGDFYAALEAATTEVLGITVPKEKWAVFGVEDVLGVDRKIGDKIFRLAEDAAVVPEVGAVEGALALLADGHDVFVATNRGNREPVEQFMEEYRLPLSVYFLKQGDKMSQADVMLDDSPKKLAGLNPFIRHSYLMDQPHNRGCLDVLKLFTRIAGWKEFLEEVRILTWTKS